MTKLVNRAKMTTATTGTGTITLGSAAAGYQSFADAGVVDGDVVRYVIEDGTNWEIGTGTYTASGTTLTRTPAESSAGGGPITLTGNAVVFVGAASADVQSGVTITGGTIDGTVIGGSTPAAISGTTGSFSGDVSIADKIVHTGDTNTAIRFPANDVVTVETNGAERLRITSTGNVGIGTSSPSEKLHVFGDSADNSLLRLGGTAAFNSFIVGYSGVGDITEDTPAIYATNTTGSAGQAGHIAYKSRTGSQARDHIFYGGSTPTERLRITFTGNVGIGTSSPQSRFDLVEIAPIFGDTRAANTNKNWRPRLPIYTSDGTSDFFSPFFISTGVGFNRITIGGGTATAFAATEVRFFTDANETTTTGSERMRITSTGSVGIGTSSPAALLEVNGGGSSGIVRVSATGRTGLELQKFVASADALINLRDNGNMRFQTNDTERMRITSTGNVGIGTSSPSEKLSVTGNVTISGSLSKGSGSFKIDHPVKPDTHHLVHSFIEGPQADNLYRGKVALVGGSATVNLDEAGRMTEGTFVALNGNVQCFTTNEAGWTQVRGKVEGNILTIKAQDPACTDEVSWLVIGERHDPHMIDANWTDDQGRVITEPKKAEITNP